jgi:quinol monooxygenase YgiN
MAAAGTAATTASAIGLITLEFGVVGAACSDRGPGSAGARLLDCPSLGRNRAPPVNLEEVGMIIVLVEIGVEASAVAGVKGAVKKMEDASRAEPGCVGYSFSVDITDPSIVRVTERWRSMEDLRTHMGMPHMAEFQQAVGMLQPKSLNIKSYEIAREVDLPR